MTANRINKAIRPAMPITGASEQQSADLSRFRTNIPSFYRDLSLASLYLAQGKREELKHIYIRLVGLVHHTDRQNALVSPLFAAGA